MARARGPAAGRQLCTIALLVAGYSGYYFCRSNFSVTLPLLSEELVAGGLSSDEATLRLGTMASLGVLAYAVGKFANGVITDYLGGRRSFLTGMGGSLLFTLAFAAGGAVPVFTLAWMANRLVQSMGWPGMVKITSRWFAHTQYARAMGVISLSFLFGDAAARSFMGALLARGLGWREVFVAVAAVMLALLAANALWLRESPPSSEAAPSTSPQSLFGAESVAARPGRLSQLLRPLLRSPSFWMVCALSLGLTLVRETFNTWTPTYFRSGLALDTATAATRSALFPLLGGVSVLLVGWLGDRFGATGRAVIIVVGLVASTSVLSVLGAVDFRTAPGWGVASVALVGFLLIGPYSFLAGAISLDLGGRLGSASVCGIVDGIGYLGGILAGGGMARIAVEAGWGAAFTTLAAVTAASTGVAFAFLRDQRRRLPAPGRLC